MGRGVTRSWPAGAPVRQAQLLQPWDGLDAVGQVDVVVALSQGWEGDLLHTLPEGLGRQELGCQQATQAMLQSWQQQDRNA